MLGFVVVVRKANAQFGHLADSASHRILMATHAGLRVVEWAKARVHSVLFFKRCLDVCEDTAYAFGKAVAEALRSLILVKRWRAEAGGCLRGSLAQHECHRASHT